MWKTPIKNKSLNQNCFIYLAACNALPKICSTTMANSLKTNISPDNRLIDIISSNYYMRLDKTWQTNQAKHQNNCNSNTNFETNQWTSPINRCKLYQFFQLPHQWIQNPPFPPSAITVAIICLYIICDNWNVHLLSVRFNYLFCSNTSFTSFLPQLPVSGHIHFVNVTHQNGTLNLIGG